MTRRWSREDALKRNSHPVAAGKHEAETRCVSRVIRQEMAAHQMVFCSVPPPTLQHSSQNSRYISRRTRRKPIRATTETDNDVVHAARVPFVPASLGGTGEGNAPSGPPPPDTPNLRHRLHHIIYKSIRFCRCCKLPVTAYRGVSVNASPCHH